MRSVNSSNVTSSIPPTNSTDEAAKRETLNHIEAFLSDTFHSSKMRPGGALPAHLRESIKENIARIMGLPKPDSAIKRALLLAHPDKNIALDSKMFRALTSLRENKVPDYVFDLSKSGASSRFASKISTVRADWIQAQYPNLQSDLAQAKADVESTKGRHKWSNLKRWEKAVFFIPLLGPILGVNIMDHHKQAHRDAVNTLQELSAIADMVARR